MGGFERGDNLNVETSHNIVVLSVAKDLLNKIPTTVAQKGKPKVKVLHFAEPPFRTTISGMWVTHCRPERKRRTFSQLGACMIVDTTRLRGVSY